MSSPFGTAQADCCSKSGAASEPVTLLHRPKPCVLLRRGMNQFLHHGVWQVYGEGERMWLA